MPAAGFEASFGGGDGPFSAEAYDEALPAAATVAGGDSVSVGGEEGGPPLEELEAQMRGELAAREVGAVASPAARRAASAAAEEEEGDGKGVALPEVDELVARLPAEVRETLDELFRARFVAVKKLPKKLLQPATRLRGGAGKGDAA